MDRRTVLRTACAAAGAALAGCTAETPAGSPTTEGSPSCSVSPDAALDSLLPPAPEGLERRVDRDVSDASLTDHEATAAVAADYVDGDDDVLDDRTVRVYRVRSGTDPERVVVDELTAIEFDSGRVGVGLAVGRVGVVAAAPDRAGAAALLRASDDVSDACFEANRVTPAETRAPDSDSPPTTSTGGE